MPECSSRGEIFPRLFPDLRAEESAFRTPEREAASMLPLYGREQSRLRDARMASAYPPDPRCAETSSVFRQKCSIASAGGTPATSRRTAGGAPHLPLPEQLTKSCCTLPHYSSSNQPPQCVQQSPFRGMPLWLSTLRAPSLVSIKVTVGRELVRPSFAQAFAGGSIRAGGE